MNDKEEYKAWVEGLKNGDSVAIRNKALYATCPWSVYTVAKVTATQLVLQDKYQTRFNRTGDSIGFVRGAGYHKIVPVTEEIQTIVERHKLHSAVETWLSGAKTDAVPLGTLRMVACLIEEPA